MSNKLDFCYPTLDYVRTKAKSFLEKNNLGDSYDGIETNAQKKYPCLAYPKEYVNTLLGDTITSVAEERGEDWNTIRDEFSFHYLSKD